MNNNEVIVKKNINEIIPNKYQPRKHFDENDLTELSNSIKQYGIINPILVRQVGDKYEIIAGERRLRAAKLCGLTEVPVIVKNVTDNQSAELALIENLHREDLTAIEAARSYEEILKLGNYTQNDLATKIGKSQSAIANKLRLLTLPEEIQKAVIEKKISERHARSLLEIDNKEKQLEILNRIINERLTVKETEELIELTNTNDEDIEQAIKDIMKSLNMSEEKEEKESDNMNNGNFFPTYDNNMTPNNNMNGAMPTSTPPITNQENVMPTFMTPQNAMEPTPPVINPTLDTTTLMQDQTMPQPVSEPIQMNETPLFNSTPQVPNFNVDTTQDQGFNNPIPQMPATDIPSFAPPTEPIQEIVMPQNIPEQTQPVIDTPLFSQPSNDLMQQPVQTADAPLFPQSGGQDNINESFYEVPVNISPVIETPQTNNRLTEVENLLSSNGISYKAYSNETGHCIIIEL